MLQPAFMAKNKYFVALIASLFPSISSLKTGKRQFLRSNAVQLQIKGDFSDSSQTIEYFFVLIVVIVEQGVLISKFLVFFRGFDGFAVGSLYSLWATIN